MVKPYYYNKGYREDDILSNEGPIVNSLNKAGIFMDNTRSHLILLVAAG